MKILYVEWDDAQSTRGWYQKETDGPCKIKSVGYEVLRTKEFLVLTTSFSGFEKYLDQLTIPIGMIRKIKILKGPS